MDYRAILALLEDKRVKFLEIEQATEQMLVEEVDGITVCMDKRAELIEEITEIDRQLQSLTQGNELAQKALSHNCGRQALPTQIGEIYDASLKVKAIVNRLLQNDSVVRTHLEEETQRIKDKLEEIGRSGSSVSAKYYDSVALGAESRGYRETGRKI